MLRVVQLDVTRQALTAPLVKSDSMEPNAPNPAHPIVISLVVVSQENV